MTDGYSFSKFIPTHVHKPSFGWRVRSWVRSVRASSRHMGVWGFIIPENIARGKTRIFISVMVLCILLFCYEPPLSRMLLCVRAWLVRGIQPILYHDFKSYLAFLCVSFFFNDQFYCRLLIWCISNRTVKKLYQFAKFKHILVRIIITYQ